ncbi:interferon-induced GTP-binding protein Mx2 [Xylariaceae sp. FL1651]|nr:interferon-induced GTP-binding protein Mx2 [Xylariaceae sp. FL1651]
MKLSNMDKTAGDEQPSSGNLSILTKVDKLRELIGTRVALPQLVVVGDQSSGKSSVLENLTGFAFPRAAELCTRYATQITCRREVEESVTVSIISNPDAAPDEQARVRKFYRTFTELSPENLARLFKDANEAMGISTSSNATTPSGTTLPAFSEHILKIEKLGPSEEHFTVIDVPGIFRKETEGVTSESDIELVMNMVKTYMKDSRTIILAIMPSNVDPATQEILKLAKKADPSMTRTMAVLTKPDLAIERATQQIAIDHVLGKRSDLTLGYYIVKNRGPDDADKTLEQGQRDERQFFATTPWSVLAHTGKVGIDCLKRRVRELLTELIKKEFPRLKIEISMELNDTRTKFVKMGPSRSSQHMQRAYLNRINEAFQSLVRDALNANYTGDKSFLNRHDIRLITRVVETSECYSDEMMREGHMRPFASENDEHDKLDETEHSDTTSQESKFDALRDEYPELEEIFDLWEPIPLELNTGDIMEYIEDVYKSSRGQELGTFGGSLLGTMFKEQSRKWEDITLKYVTLIICHVHHFVSEAVKITCTDPKVREELWHGYLLEDLLNSYRRAIHHAKFLLEIEREGCPLTLNHYFNDNLQKAQADRLALAIEKLGVENSDSDSEGDPSIKLSQLRSLSIDKSNTTQVREYMHDILYSYYKVSWKRFVDVVYQQAVNYYLLSGKHSPLRVFNTEMVLNLNEEQLDMIAGEDAPVKERREKLSRDIESFETALKVLKGSG